MEKDNETEIKKSNLNIAMKVIEHSQSLFGSASGSGQIGRLDPGDEVGNPRRFQATGPAQRCRLLLFVSSTVLLAARKSRTLELLADVDPLLGAGGCWVRMLLLMEEDVVLGVDDVAVETGSLAARVEHRGRKRVRTRAPRRPHQTAEFAARSRVQDLIQLVLFTTYSQFTIVLLSYYY